MYNSSSNPFPSSIHGFPPPSGSFYDHEKDGGFFHHHNNHHNHHPFVTGDSSFQHPTTTTTTTTTTITIVPPTMKASEVVVQQYCNNNNNHNHFSDSVVSSFPSKTTKVSTGSKKDRHSKIFTAQGPRDRRVRLSIDISRKFFGLQDLLGFDKASKTLDWLFTKSKTAIKDLVEEMKQNSSSSTLTHQCEEVFMGKSGDHHLDDEKIKAKKSKKQPVSKCGNNNNNGAKKKTKKTTQKSQKFHVNLAARSQLRAEARARARERTIEKLQKLRNESKNVVIGNQNYCFQIQSQSNQDVKIGDIQSAAAMEQKLIHQKPYSLLYMSSSHHSCFVESKDSTSQFKNSTTH